MMIKISTLAKTVFSSPIHFLAFGFGSGLSPIAPGTMGTLVAIPLYLLLASASPIIYMAVLVLMFVVGVWICEASASRLGLDDPSGIVWDEWVGYLVTMLMAPKGWHWVLLGFVLFRLFDIWKPYPIYWFDQQVKGGMGIMVDDIIAGLYALIIIQTLAYFI